MSITTVIPAQQVYTGPIALRSSSLTFDADAEQQLTFIAANQAAANAQATAANSVATEMNALSVKVNNSADVALSSANYAGEWSTLTGALSKNVSVSHKDSFYMLLNNLANVALSEPGVTADWQSIQSITDTIARSLNVANNAVLLGVAGSIILSTTKYLWVPDQQITYGLPSAVGVGEVIVGVVGDVLNTDGVGSPYSLSKVTIPTAFESAYEMKTGSMSDGDLVTTGGTAWKIALTGDYLLDNGLFATALNYVDVADFGDTLADSNEAILACGDKIRLLYSNRIEYKPTGNIVVNSKLSPSIVFDKNAVMTAQSGFVFTAGERGIITFRSCSNPVIENPNIIGCMENKLNATEPAEDGDAGIEYINCTGLCDTVSPNIRDVMTWGVIHVKCEDTRVTDPVLYNCIVQSGVGHAGTNTSLVTNILADEIGLYGVEVETSLPSKNEGSSVIGGRVKNSQKGVVFVGSTHNAVCSSVTAELCKEAFSAQLTLGHTAFDSTNQSINCRNALVLNNPTGHLGAVQSVRTVDEAYLRGRSYDYVLKLSGTNAVIQDRDVQRANLGVGTECKFLNGIIATVVSTTESTDPVFGRVQTVAFDVELDSSFKSMSFKRKNSLLDTKYCVMYDGIYVTVRGGSAERAAVMLESFGYHNNLQWENNAAKIIDNYFRVTSGGTAATGTVSIKASDCQQVLSIGTGDLTKFQNVASETKSLAVIGKVLNKYRTYTGFVTIVRAYMASGSTTTGSIAVVLNGVTYFLNTDTNPTVNAAHNAAVSGSISANFTDTVGDLVTLGGSIELFGFFIK